MRANTKSWMHPSWAALWFAVALGSALYLADGWRGWVAILAAVGTGMLLVEAFRDLLTGERTKRY